MNRNHRDSDGEEYVSNQKNISNLIQSNPDYLLTLEVEELAVLVLEDLKTIINQKSRSYESRHNYGNNYRESDEKILQALMEAWQWLEQMGFLTPKPLDAGGDWFFISRRGERLLESKDFSSLKYTNILSKEQLHPILVQRAWPPFIRGDYESAIFQAFKQVEIEVRQAGGFVDSDFGVALMRKAFHPEKGPLRDTNTELSERESLTHLFAGAIGCFKNPSSHRNVDLNNPHETAELIMFASHLLRVIDKHSTQDDSQEV